VGRGLETPVAEGLQRTVDSRNIFLWPNRQAIRLIFRARPNADLDARREAEI